jgi:geranyl-CoA carboxylase alpha subunit
MQRLLIANRGEIALRILRTAHAMGLETVAVFSETDANALHVQAATHAFALGGQTPAQSYLDIAKLLAAAKATGADAVHPGYGFLSENPDFADAVIAAGLVWVGPSPASMRLLGSKAAAKQLARATGVPCLPGYDGLDEQGQPSPEAQSDQRFLAEAQRIGWPLMVKAINGGGGRGMRRVDHPADLATALASARHEAQTAFGDPSLLLERALINPRHIEVQVFGDTHGHIIHLGERDCSVQRRNQKIIEESPSPALTQAQRQAICQAAVALAQAAHYTNAGTVEFLLEEHAVPTVGVNSFFLMEMNTRLQVEHPVTELRYGVDLVEWQLRVARGEPLPSAGQPSGHAVELRLCAEDENFVPHGGQVDYFAGPPAPLRLDHAIRSDSRVSPHFDPMLGKLIAHGETREQAIAQALIGLSQTTLLGLPNNLPLLGAILQSPDFRNGKAHIGWLTQAHTELLAHLAHSEQSLLPLAAAACYLLGDAAQPAPIAHALACPYARPLTLLHRQRTVAFSVTPSGASGLWVQSPGDQPPLRITWQHPPHGADPSTAVLHLIFEVNGLRHRVVALRQSHGQVHVQIDGLAFTVVDQSLQAAPSAGASQGAAQLRAPMNGKVLAVLAQVGATVKKGDALVVLESMKLEHRLLAPKDGTVTQIACNVGQQAATAQLLVTLSQ